MTKIGGLCWLFVFMSCFGIVAMSYYERSTLAENDNHATNSSFDPSGTWKISFGGDVGGYLSGASIYSREANVLHDIVAGKVFKSSNYMAADLGLMHPMANITITYNSDSTGRGRTVTLSGGPSTSERVLYLSSTDESLPIDSGLGPDFLSFEKDVSAGCHRHEGYKEYLRFNSSKQMIYNIIHYFQFKSTDQNNSCKTYLGQTLSSEIKAGQESDFWRALSDSKALNMDKIQFLMVALIVSSYTGTSDIAVQ